jgi:nucleotide-binding universal stress UspA family protein
MSFSRILVPIDGSDPSGRALQLGLQLAASTGAALEVVTVLDLGQLDFYRRRAG